MSMKGKKECSCEGVSLFLPHFLFYETVSSLFLVITLTHVLGELSEHSGGRRLHTRTDGQASQEPYRGDISLNGIRWLLMLKESSINL